MKLYTIMLENMIGPALLSGIRSIFVYVLSLLLLGGSLQLKCEELHTVGFSKISSSQFKSIWQPLRFAIFSRSTHYRLAVPEGPSADQVLHASSRDTASGIMQIISIKPTSLPILSWRWRVDKFPTVRHEGTREGDDYAARLYILFSAAQPPQQGASPVQVFAHAHAINYLWSRELPLNQHLASPFDGRSQMLVASSGDQAVGQWVEVSRNLVEDYRAIFKKEPPPIVGIAIMTDSDNSDSTAEAWYGDIVFSKDPDGVTPKPN